MTLTRHTQVENLANLLAARRREVLAEGRRDRAYSRLVATILDEPVDDLGAARLPTPLARPPEQAPQRRERAA